MLLFFDTETTGKFNFGKRGQEVDIMDPSQPRVCQLSALLVDDRGCEVQRLDAIIKPDGWVIPPDATAVHGISQEMAETQGIPMREVLPIFASMVRRADKLVCQNPQFDLSLMQREGLTYGTILGMGDKKTFDTMFSATKIVQAPYPNGRKGFKWPKLHESYRFFFGEEFGNQHNAAADVDATRDVYFALQHWKHHNPDNNRDPDIMAKVLEEIRALQRERC